MEKSFGLFFHLKTIKNVSAIELPIYLRLTIDGQRTEISLKRKCDPQHWHVGTGRVICKTETGVKLNEYLDTIQQNVFDAKRKLIDLGLSLNASIVKAVILGFEPGKEKHMLLETFKAHNEEVKNLVGVDFAAGTLERYLTSYKHTESFIWLKYRKSDIPVTELDYQFISANEYWLKSVRRCNQNTTIKYLGNFRKIVNRCIKYGWLSRDPFTGFTMKKKTVIRIALTQEELKKLAEKQFSIERLKIVRDIFLFSCYTGLAYIDVKNLKISNIQTGIDGEQWIFAKRQKTNTNSRIPLLPGALSIIKEYEDGKKLLDDRVLPILSN